MTQASRSHPWTFMALPSEIRVAVYAHYFHEHSKQISYPFLRPVSLIDDRFWPLLLVSKGVYADALPEYYRSCYYNLCSLDAPHRQKLIQNMADTAFSRYACNLLVYRLPEPELLDAFQQVKWVRILGITCGIKPHPTTGQSFTYHSLIKALSQSPVPGFSWPRYRSFFERFKHVNFMLDIRCESWEIKLDADSIPRPRSIKTNFVYDVSRDKFIEYTGNRPKTDGLVLFR